MDEREFPETPMLMQMLGLFGDVCYNEEGSACISVRTREETRLMRNIYLDGRLIGSLRFVDDGHGSKVLFYSGTLPCEVRGKSDLPFRGQKQTMLKYDLNKRRRLDTHRDILFP